MSKPAEFKLRLTGESHARFHQLARRFENHEEMFRTVFAIGEVLYGIQDLGGEIFARFPGGEERPIELSAKEEK